MIYFYIILIIQMFSYDSVIANMIESIFDEYTHEFETCDDVDKIDIQDIIHTTVDNDISVNHFILNKQIIEEHFDKDIFEVLKDYTDEYGEMDFSDGKVMIYARLAYFAIINYGSFREDIDTLIDDYTNSRSETTTEKE